FLDALAQKLTNLYDFEWGYGAPTIGDVFRTVHEVSWDFRRMEAVDEETLTRLFHRDEWGDLKELDERTNKRIHDGKVPTTTKGSRTSSSLMTFALMSE
ncbi:hypothetical protein PI126_g21263, partial [Phytophthora idaei]